MTTNEQIARTILQHMLEALAGRGWKALSMSDGEDLTHLTSTHMAIDAVIAVSESRIDFYKHTDSLQMRRAVLFIPSNGIDCIVDHALSNPSIAEDDFEKVMGLVDDFVESLGDRS